MKRKFSTALMIATGLVLTYINRESHQILSGSAEPTLSPSTSNPVVQHADSNPSLTIKLNSPTAKARRTQRAVVSLASLPKDVETFRGLSRKALRNREEQEELKRILRSRVALGESLDFLQNHHERAMDQDNKSIDHQHVLRFLHEAVLAEANQERDYVLPRIRELIVADNLHAGLSREILREVAADKGELTLTYLSADPEHEYELLTATHGTNNERVIRNALAYAQRRRVESLQMLNEYRRRREGSPQ
jgi:hypothetical protein